MTQWRSVLSFDTTLVAREKLGDIDTEYNAAQIQKDGFGHKGR